MTKVIHIWFPGPDGGRFHLTEILSDDFINSPEAIRNPYRQQIHRFLKWWFHSTNHLVMTTSGSTGKPKELRFKRDQIEAAARSSMQLLGPEPSSKCLLAIDPTFAGGAMLMVRSLLAESDIVCIPPVADPFSLDDESIYAGLDYVALVPYQVRSILQNETSKRRMAAVRTVLIGGAPLPESLHQELAELPNGIFSTFGMTETLSHVALWKIGQLPQGYKPVPGVNLSADESGCLVIRSNWLGEIRTQDRVQWVTDTDGAMAFRWIGRADRIINSGGHLINPDMTEAVLEEFMKGEPTVTAYFATGEPDERLDEQLIIVVETMDDGSGDLMSRLVTFIQSKLTKWDRPRRIIFTDNILRTRSGKVDRRETMSNLQPRKRG